MSQTCILLFLLAVILGLRSHVVTPQPPSKPNAVGNQCEYGPMGTKPANAEYASNVVTLMAGFKNKSASEFSYTASLGSGADKVYAQYYCRPDIDSSLCEECVQEASLDSCIQVNISNKTTVWYEECTLRYNNRSMDGVLDLNINLIFTTYYINPYSNDNVTDSDKFGRVLKNTVDAIIDKAAFGNGFATGEGVVSETETVYCLVQCSPDLNATQCDNCLQAAYDYMKSTSEQWRRSRSMFYSSCQMRYSNYGAFYSLPTAPPPATSPPPPSTPLASTQGKGSSYYAKAIVIVAAAVSLLFIVAVSFCIIKRRRVFSFRRQHVAADALEDGYGESDVRNMDCVQFDLKTVEDATNGFSVSNILGRGGFGMVYQGVLKDGKDIAVKKLSKSSGQGTTEFKTEVAVLAKLQHKNLVQLVGYCVGGEERLLVYEFLSNLSLDSFLYDATKSTFLTWEIRKKIIQGIARGLHYLHEDSRVKIVHRDLKISNILLDNNLDPKIADFGLAKLVMVDQTSNHTARVVGTYGYMSPEYALTGRYSTKSDVYSFGVIVLEILSGKISSRFYETSQGEGLLNYAWRMWNEGTIEKLMDPVLQNNYSRIEAERCLQIGLLCVQDDEANRPPMHAVLVMLISNNAEIPPPLTLSHSSYINKLTLGDTTEGLTNTQNETGSTKSSIPYSLNEAETR